MLLQKPAGFFTLLCTFAIVIFLSGSCRERDMETVASEIEKIGDRWVPDLREGVYDIRISRGEKGKLVLCGETNSIEALEALTSLTEQSSGSLLNHVKYLPNTSDSSNFRGLITLSVANMRSQPAYEAELVSQAILGTPVLVLKAEDSWFLIQTPERYISWIPAGAVKTLSNDEFVAWRNAQRVIFLDNCGFVYDTPAEKSVVSDLVAGAILEKTDVLVNHTGVRFPDGRTGYVRNNQVEDFNSWKNKRFNLQENTGIVARSFNGMPYLWGGNSSKALDCSGFVKTVYFLNGIVLARDASQQFLYGTDVDISDGWRNLRKGDLLFFGSRKDTAWRITHVALYIGDSEYMHASGMVMTNSLDSLRNNYSRYRSNTLAGARRIKGSQKSRGIVPIAEHPWY